MSLEISMIVHERKVDVAFHVAPKECLAIVGPNASGKSSVLLGIAGLLNVDEGLIALGGRTLFASGRAIKPVNVPVHKRQISMLAQRPLLFPHLSVRHNVEFGPRSLGVPRTEVRKRAMGWLERVDMAHLADRRASELSGGQSQRVALARALAVEPELLLLDEPMAALDAEAVPAMRSLLAEVSQERTTVLVTHDLLDAISLSARAIVIEEGRVTDEGLTERVLLQPRTSFGARLGGLNVLRGLAEGPDCVVTADGQKVYGTPQSALLAGQRAIAVFNPSSVIVTRSEIETSARNTFSARIDAIDQRDGRCRVSAGGFVVDVTVSALVELRLAPGQTIHLMVKAMEVALHPA